MQAQDDHLDDASWPKDHDQKDFHLQKLIPKLLRRQHHRQHHLQQAQLQQRTQTTKLLFLWTLTLKELILYLILTNPFDYTDVKHAA